MSTLGRLFHRLFYLHDFTIRYDQVRGINAYYTLTCAQCGFSRRSTRFNEYCLGPGCCVGEKPGCIRCESLLLGGPPPSNPPCFFCGDPASDNPPCCITRRDKSVAQRADA